jgi:hypothetical protein
VMRKKKAKIKRTIFSSPGLTSTNRDRSPKKRFFLLSDNAELTYHKGNQTVNICFDFFPRLVLSLPSFFGLEEYYDICLRP